MLTNQWASKLSKKLGDLLKTDIESGNFLRLRINMDITKPLRKFVTVAMVGGQRDIQARLAYERLPTFCYECGMIGHSDIECDIVPIDYTEESNMKQYGDWLRASPVAKFNQNWNMGGVAKIERKFEGEPSTIHNRGLKIAPPGIYDGAPYQRKNITALSASKAVSEYGEKEGSW